MEEQDLVEIEEKPKKIDPVGLQIYGEGFVKFQLISEMVDLVPAFKDYYYTFKIKDPNASLSEILGGFNKELFTTTQRYFHPRPSQIRVWRKHWDFDLMQRMKDGDLELIERKNVYQAIKTRNENNELVIGKTSVDELEQGVQTLGGELINDALQILTEDQELGELIDDEILIKRKKYVVDVFAHVTKLVHGKAALMLKMSEEKRNTAGFLMSLLNRAASGQMTKEEIDLLETAYIPKQNATSESK